MDVGDYFELTSQLDAREILRYLNQLGIYNINGEVLKLFIKDLKKLIKYDLSLKTGNIDKRDNDIILGPERLHSASTFSSRLKSKNQGAWSATCTRECQKDWKPLTVRNIRSAPSMREQKIDDELPKRACSCVRPEKRTQTLNVPKPSIASSSNLIKVPKQPNKKKCDPVSLYHYYISQWAKYKPNVPGENNWADLRWNIRQKMVRSTVGSTKNQVIDKENTRPKNPKPKNT